MSCDINLRDFDLSPVINSNGVYFMEYQATEEIARFLAFVAANPEHELDTDYGPLTCADFKRRFIDTGRVSSGPTDGEVRQALRDYGWLRTDVDGVERMHNTRGPRKS